MSLPKIILFGSIAVFAVIGVTALVKKDKHAPQQVLSTDAKVEPKKSETDLKPSSVAAEKTISPLAPKIVEDRGIPLTAPNAKDKQDGWMDIDRIHLLFSTSASKFPIVETISYTARVSWLKGRPAWLADYASHYATSRHFIARSLNGKADYLTQKVYPGSRFNVYRKDKHFQFHLLVDASRCKMGLYYYDLDTKERVLLKTYQVGLAKSLAPQSTSHQQTSLGKYQLGNKVAIYKPGNLGYFHDQKIEMVHVFGTRWIPLIPEQQTGTGSAPSKGYGLHGVPLIQDTATGQLVENKSSIGKCLGEGGIQLSNGDIEELFAVVITKPTYLEIVKDFREAQLPGTEVATPTR